MINEYLVYILLAITVTAIPGPAVILTIKNSLNHGYKVAIVNIVGNFIAMVILASLSAVGLGAILVTSSNLFTVLKIIGCIYLIYLGIVAWRTPAVSNNAKIPGAKIDRKKMLSVFKEGFGVGITNPKAIAFFVALFPQFIDLSRSYTPQFLTLILTIEGVSFLVLSIYAVLASYASAYLVKERASRIFNKITAIAFVGFGVALLYEL